MVILNHLELQPRRERLHVGLVQEGNLTVDTLETSTDLDSSASSGRVERLPGVRNRAGTNVDFRQYLTIEDGWFDKL